MKRPVPLAEIAAQVGVSTATVSRALKRPDLVREETREAIVSAARKAGHLGAGETSASKTRLALIGLVVPDIENPFFSMLAKSVLQELRRSGIGLIVADTNEDATEEREIVASVLQRVDGMIVASSRLEEAEIRELISGNKPVVLINRDVPEISSIVIDYRTGSRQAVEHLAALGHVRIGYAEGPPNSWSNTQRRQSFEAAMADLGLEAAVFGPYAPKFDGGVQAADIAVARRLTAVVAYNDLMAFGVMSRLTNRGIQVPNQISVVGFDDVPQSSIWSPALSTVHVPIGSSGRLAALTLLRAIKSGVGELSNRRLVTQLVVRSSTAPVRQIDD